MLERMLEDGKTQAGIYANGFRFFEAANNIAFLFASLLLPLFSNLLKNVKTYERDYSKFIKTQFSPEMCSFSRFKNLELNC
jgi:O-antigen/teichoic acid export membrane protein